VVFKREFCFSFFDYVTDSPTCGLGIWLGGAALAHTGLSLYLVALLHLSSFFRFDVLVTVHLYDSL
jgi:hypothetical protein